MKRLLSGVAIVAALTFAAPVWAQQAPPGAPGAGAPEGPPTTSAAPPEHHAVRHARAMHHFHRHMARRAAATGDTTAQLNRQELARIQQGNTGMPAPQSAMPGMQSGPPPVIPPAVAPAQQPGGVACAQGYVWLPEYWDRLNVFHKGQCVTNQEYQHLYTHMHS